MSEAVVLFLLKTILPLIIDWLRSEGYMDAADALEARAADKLLVAFKSLKAYPVYPGDQPLPEVQTNLTSGG